MNRVVLRVIIAILAALPFLVPLPSIGSPASPVSEFDVAEYTWAYGRIIDSIEVEGNSRVKDIAVLRELESRVGRPLDAVALERDQRWIGDLSVFASVVFVVEPVGPDRCSIHIRVEERPVLLLRLIYPVLDYDFNNQRIRYGVRWRDKNFRKRLEGFTVDATRDTDNNDNASISWGTRWVGWRHLGLSARTAYFHRTEPGTQLGIVEQSTFGTGISYPLTESRLAFAQILGGLSVSNNRISARGLPSEDEIVITPSIGFLYDGRDSPLKPRRGALFFINLQTNAVANGHSRAYYRADQSIRLFRPLDDHTVLALYSNLSGQFGEYPSYIRFGLGGPGTLRGYKGGVFNGAHRWIKTVELRITPWPKWIYRVPFAGVLDVTVSLVAFADAGIVWSAANEFSVHNYHSGGGVGLRIYSPIQDVIRLDVGMNPRGSFRAYFSTGARF